MSRFTSRLFVLSGLSFAAACGGNDLAPGAGDDPGSGTHTLFVDADVQATPRLTNASSAADFQSHFEVSVAKDGLAVTSGTVTVVSEASEVALVYDAGNNRWTGRQDGYHEVYELTVRSGDDAVDAVRLDGPSPHHFTEPQPGATVDALMPLVVRWARDEAAAAADFETEEMDSISIADTGSFEVPVGGLKSNGGETEQERLRLDRFARISPAGAVAGSELRVEVRNEIEILVQPTGL